MAGQFGCSFCAGTGIHVETRFRDEEQILDRSGHILLAWELTAISPERRRAMVASGELVVRPITIEYQVADPTRFCRHCEAGREREHQALHKRTRTRKNLEGERDAS